MSRNVSFLPVCVAVSQHWTSKFRLRPSFPVSLSEEIGVFTWWNAEICLLAQMDGLQEGGRKDMRWVAYLFEMLSENSSSLYGLLSSLPCIPRLGNSRLTVELLKFKCLIHKNTKAHRTNVFLKVRQMTDLFTASFTFPFPAEITARRERNRAAQTEQSVCVVKVIFNRSPGVGALAEAKHAVKKWK